MVQSQKGMQKTPTIAVAVINEIYFLLSWNQTHCEKKNKT